MGRVDLFTAVHKAVRALVYDVGLSLQPFDARNAGGKQVLDRLERALGMLEEHHQHEERAVFTHLRRFEPDMIADLEAQHREVKRLIDLTHEALATVRAGESHDAAAAAAQLNRHFNALIAYYLRHLADEESTALPASQKHFGDPELVAMQQDIDAGIEPDRYADWMKWTLLGLNRAELTPMLAGMKAMMPQAALDGMKQMAAGILGQERWEIVARDAEL